MLKHFLSFCCLHVFTDSRIKTVQLRDVWQVLLHLCNNLTDWGFITYILTLAGLWWRVELLVSSSSGVEQRVHWCELTRVWVQGLRTSSVSGLPGLTEAECVYYGWKWKERRPDHKFFLWSSSDSVCWVRKQVEVQLRNHFNRFKIFLWIRDNK